MYKYNFRLHPVGGCGQGGKKNTLLIEKKHCNHSWPTQRRKYWLTKRIWISVQIPFFLIMLLLFRAAAWAYNVKLPTVLPYWGCLDNREKNICAITSLLYSYNARMSCRWSKFTVKLGLETVETVPKIRPNTEEANY